LYIEHYGPSSKPINSSTVQPFHAPRSDEINLLEYAYVLVKNKWWIIGLTVLGLVLGYVAAIIKGPTWVAEVMIAPHETESQKNAEPGRFGRPRRSHGKPA